MTARRRPRKRRRNSRGDDFAGYVFLGIVVVSIVGTVIQATHGLILLVPLAVGGGVLARRRRAARAQAAWEAEQLRQEAERRAQERARQQELATDLGQLLAGTPTEFEHVVGHVLARYGFELTHAGRTCDRGVDLEGLAPNGQRCIVQVKLYARARSVSGPEVRAFLGAMAQARAEIGVFVTTARYTREARAAADGQPLALVDGPLLVDLARDCVNPDTEAALFGA